MVELGPGAQFGPYRIEGVAGQGGMGVVYRATQLGLDRTIALKVIAPAFAHDPEFRERFKRESKLAASIEHPNVIPVYEAGEHDGVLFMAMRFVEGTDVKSLLVREGRLEPIRAARFVAQIAAALDAAHAAGLVHRDVKPANALLATSDHVYLTDFGLTKRAASGSAMTKTGQMVGTVDYVAPEQVEGGSVDARTDVYSLACVLFHLVTGRVPFDKPTEMAKLFAHVNEAPPAPSNYVPGLPPEIDAVVARGMAKNPAERFLSAGDLGRAGVDAAEHRAFATPERSVARGDAAPDPAEVARASTVVTEHRPGAVASGQEAHGSASTVAPHPAAAAPAEKSRRTRTLAIAAVAAVLVAVVAGLLLMGGGGDGGSGEDGGDIATAAAEQSGERFVQAVHDESIDALRALFRPSGHESFMRGDTCSDADQPMDLEVALEEWQCVFDDKDDLTMSMEAVRFNASTSMLTATYALLDGEVPFRNGELEAHLVPDASYPRIDSLSLSGSFDDPAVDTSEITRSGAINTATYFADYYEDENLSGFEERFADGFEQTDDGQTCSEAKQPMDIDAALEEYRCWFDQLETPEMRLQGIKYDSGTKTVSANYRVIDKGKAVRIGKLVLELVPSDQPDQDPNIRRVAFTGE